MGKQFDDVDIKSCGLNILEAVHTFCEQNNLKYILFYGSLLGAVRHKGFIPWDDDIDIAMPREDYEFFIKSFDTEHYGVKHCTNDKGHYLPWAKAYDKRTIKTEFANVSKKYQIGFDIDVFPIDLLSSSENYWVIKNKEIKYIRLLKLSINRVSTVKTLKDFLKKMIKPLFLTSSNYFAKKIEYFFIKNDKTIKKTCYVSNAIFAGINSRSYVFPLTLFDKRTLVKFENGNYYIPNDFDVVLKTCYDNYMEFPPEEERIAHHDFIAFYK